MENWRQFIFIYTVYRLRRFSTLSDTQPFLSVVCCVYVSCTNRFPDTSLRLHFGSLFFVALVDAITLMVLEVANDWFALNVCQLPPLYDFIYFLFCAHSYFYDFISDSFLSWYYEGSSHGGVYIHSLYEFIIIFIENILWDIN